MHGGLFESGPLLLAQVGGEDLAGREHCQLPERAAAALARDHFGATMLPQMVFSTGTKMWSPSTVTCSRRSPCVHTPSTMSNLRARWRKKMRVVFHGLVRIFGAAISRSTCSTSFSAR